MDRVTSAMIDLAEAAYDLDIGESDWLPRVIEAGLPALEHGLGVAGGAYTRPLVGGEVALHQLHVASCPEEFAQRHAAALATTAPDLLREHVRPGRAGTASMDSKGDPAQLAHYASHVKYCKDLLYMTAVDCRGSGVAIVAPLEEVTELTGHDARRWKMLAAHVDAGHRLRCGLAASKHGDEPCTDLPHNAEALLDPMDFEIKEAVGAAKESDATKALRNAAMVVDRARGRMRKSNPDAALRIWRALVRGRWSMVDWFDSDGRRFVLALPNSPRVGDPRGLTERESQVVAYAALGESGKIIGHRIGLSTPRVSSLLHDAMRKLNVHTQAELVEKMRSLSVV